MKPQDATPVQVWTTGQCAGPPGHGYGGWAWLAVQGGVARGAAGGERHTTGGRMALRAVLEALKGLAESPAVPLQLDPGAASLAALAADLPGRKAAGWRTAEGDPLAEADLWAALAEAVAARGGPVRFVAGATLGRADPGGFVAAWSEFARDRCKAKGAFTSAIPKPNLAGFLAKRGAA